jgi:hypothetical protein
MKKVFASLVICCALLTAGSSYAQYEKGDKLLNAGIGLGTYGYGGLGFGGSLEFGITDDISAGALVGYSGTNYFGSRFSVLTIGGRGSYHFNKLLNLGDEKIDLYAGLGLAYRNITWNYSGLGSDSYGSGILLLAHLGGRYYFKENIGVFAEVGSGFGTLQAGLAFKF